MRVMYPKEIRDGIEALYPYLEFNKDKHQYVIRMDAPMYNEKVQQLEELREKGSAFDRSVRESY